MDRNSVLETFSCPKAGGGTAGGAFVTVGNDGFADSIAGGSRIGGDLNGTASIPGTATTVFALKRLKAGALCALASTLSSSSLSFLFVGGDEDFSLATSG
jgi:hypothetical protein